MLIDLEACQNVFERAKYVQNLPDYHKKNILYVSKADYEICIELLKKELNVTT